VVFGLESPNPERRELFGKKGYDPGEIETMMSTLERDLDIMVSVYLLFGAPEDTEESLDSVLAYARKLYPDYCSFVVGSMAIPFPGTEKFVELHEKGLISSYNWDDYGFGKSVTRTNIPPEKLQETFRGFWIRTYVRPKAFLKQVRMLLSGNRFRRAMAKQYVSMAIEMISDVKEMEG
jgi:radical SAM superfamily enzyme YgiQ (UPF0313 family)